MIKSFCMLFTVPILLVACATHLSTEGTAKAIKSLESRTGTIKSSPTPQFTDYSAVYITNNKEYSIRKTFKHSVHKMVGPYIFISDGDKKGHIVPGVDSPLKTIYIAGGLIPYGSAVLSTFEYAGHSGERGNLFPMAVGNRYSITIKKDSSTRWDLAGC